MHWRTRRNFALNVYVLCNAPFQSAVSGWRHPTNISVLTSTVGRDKLVDFLQVEANPQDTVSELFREPKIRMTVLNCILLTMLLSKTATRFVLEQLSRAIQDLYHFFRDVIATLRLDIKRPWRF